MPSAPPRCASAAAHTRDVNRLPVESHLADIDALPFECAWQSSAERRRAHQRRHRAKRFADGAFTRSGDEQSVVDGDDHGVELALRARVLELKAQCAVRILTSACAAFVHEGSLPDVGICSLLPYAARGKDSAEPSDFHKIDTLSRAARVALQ